MSYRARSNGLNNYWASHYPQARVQRRDEEPALGSLPERADQPGTRIPPPSYHPSAPIPLTQTTSSGSSLQRTRSRWTGNAASLVVIAPWRYHPALSSPAPLLWRLGRFLRKQAEAVDERWPSEFARAAILARDDRREGEMVLTNASHMEAKLAAKYSERIETLNETVAAHLVPTRLHLALVEIVDLLWLVLLIIALGVTRARQEGFLTGVEIALIPIIMLNAGVYNNARLCRWRLARKLKQYSVDWSPLPMTSSTARGLVANYVGPTEANGDVEARADSNASAEGQPALRWALFGSQGGVWTAYRPLIRVELIVPSSRWYTRTSTEAGASLEDYVPLYTKDIGKDESQVSPAAPGAPTT